MDNAEATLASFEMNVIPSTNAIADNIASISPGVITRSILEPPLMMVAKKPASAVVAPAICSLLNLSCRIALARSSMTIVSKGPASSTSFEAPTLLTESHQV